MEIKTKKQLNLPQLIEWAWDNDVREEWFYSDSQAQKSSYGIEFDEDGDFISRVALNSDLLFTVEVEEEITEDTRFKRLVCINDNDRTVPFSNFTIRELKDIGAKEFHAYIDGEFKCIWRNGKVVV